MNRNQDSETQAVEQIDATPFAIAKRLFSVQFPSAQTGDAFELAITLALDQFVKSLRPRKTNDPETGHVYEETATAALIGFLSMAFSAVGMLELMSGDHTSLPTMSWGYQDKNTEAVSGGDFGIAFEEPGNEILWLAFFQAKTLSEDGTLDVHRYTKGPKKDADAARVRADFDLEELLKDAHHEAGFTTNIAAGHQLAKLTSTRNKGWKSVMKGYRTTEWTHYAIWSRTGAPPQALSLRSVIDFLRPHWQDKKTPVEQKSNTSMTVRLDTENAENAPSSQRDGSSMETPLPPAPVSFHRLLADSRNAPGRHIEDLGWLAVSPENASKLIGSLLPLGQTWMLFGGSDGAAARVAADIHRENVAEKLHENAFATNRAQPVGADTTDVYAPPRPKQ